jgi:hypothetical protein
MGFPHQVALVLPFPRDTTDLFQSSEKENIDKRPITRTGSTHKKEFNRQYSLDAQKNHSESKERLSDRTNARLSIFSFSELCPLSEYLSCLARFSLGGLTSVLIEAVSLPDGVSTSSCTGFAIPGTSGTWS